MIAAAIGQIAKELNLALSRQFGDGEELVVVSALVGSDGAAAPQAIDKLALFLVNIERDPVAPRGVHTTRGSGERVGIGAAPVNLNLLLMVAANFSGNNYPEALKLISHTLAYFQANPVLNHHNAPELSGDIDRLVLEIEDLSTTELSNLWGVLGGRYLPSVLYRVRMVSVDAARLSGQAPRISAIARDGEARR